MSERSETPVFSSGQVGVIIGRSDQTVRTWTDEYAEFLSPMAVVGDGRHRVYKAEDIAVLKLIRQMKDAKFRPDEIVIALRRGDRAEVDDLNSMVTAIEIADLDHKRLQLEYELLQKDSEKISQALQVALEKVKQVDDLKDENSRLSASVLLMEQQLQRIAGVYVQYLRQREAEIQQLRQQLADQNREVGKGAAATEQLAKVEEEYRQYYWWAYDQIKNLEEQLIKAHADLEAWQAWYRSQSGE